MPYPKGCADLKGSKHGISALKIGLRIKKFRKKKKYKAYQLAEKSKISPAYISMIEKGQRYASLVTLSKIADALKVPVWKLVRK